MSSRVPGWLRDRRLLVGAGAVVVALVLLAVGALWGGWRPFTTDPAVVTFGPGGDVAAFSLFDGQCASGNFRSSRGFAVDSDAPCGEPHDVEVIGSRTPLDEGRPVSYPGEDALARFGRAYCSLVFDSAVVADTSGGVAKSSLRVTAVIPSQAAFEAPRSADASSSGARQVTCVISRADGGKLGDRFNVI